MNSTVKTVLFWLLIGVSALLLWEVVKGARDGQKDAEALGYIPLPANVVAKASAAIANITN